MNTTKRDLNNARKLELKDKLIVGAFVKNVWGSTMQRVSYYQVVSIDGSTIGLRHAVISGRSKP